jgi:hypothetical protein
MRHANYSIVEDTDKHIVLRDLGPWDQYPTITNDAEAVVEDLAQELGGRRLFYIDSEGQKDELLVSATGQFAGFKPGS